MQTHLIGVSHVTEEEPLSEFSLPKDAMTRLCFFAVPLALQPQYRDQVFPPAEMAGLVPVTAADVIAPGDSYAAKIDAILRRAIAAVVDVGTPNTMMERAMITRMPNLIDTAVVVEEGEITEDGAVGDFVAQHRLRRRGGPLSEQPMLLSELQDWFSSVAERVGPRLAAEPQRLLDAREHRAAVIAAMTHLESVLRLALQKEERFPGRAYSLVALTELAVERGLVLPDERSRIRDWIGIRNAAVHSQQAVTRATASAIVAGVMAIGDRMAR